MKSILLVGQSNMAGRGFMTEVEPIINERIKVLKKRTLAIYGRTYSPR